MPITNVNIGSPSDDPGLTLTGRKFTPDAGLFPAPWPYMVMWHSGGFEDGGFGGNLDRIATDFNAVGFAVLQAQTREMTNTLPGQTTDGKYRQQQNDAKIGIRYARNQSDCIGFVCGLGGSGGSNLALQNLLEGTLGDDKLDCAVGMSTVTDYSDRSVGVQEGFKTTVRAYNRFADDSGTNLAVMLARSPIALVSTSMSPWIAFNGDDENMPLTQHTRFKAAVDALNAGAGLPLTQYTPIVNTGQLGRIHAFAMWAPTGVPGVKDQALAFVLARFADWGGSPPPPPPPGNVGYRGASALVGGGGNVKQSVISHPSNLISLRVPWWQVSPSPIMTDFSYFQTQMTTVLAQNPNKKFILTVQTGRGSAYYGGSKPTWIFPLLHGTGGIHLNSHGVTTAGSATVTVGTNTFSAGDVGKRIFGSAVVSGVWKQLIPNKTYIGIVNSQTSIGLSSSSGSNIPVNALLSANPATISTWPEDGRGEPDSHNIDPGVTYSWANSDTETITIPVPWHSVYQARKRALITAWGKWRDGLDPSLKNAIVAVRVAYCNATSDDFNLPDDDTAPENSDYTRTQVQRWLDATGAGGAGYTTQKMIDTAVTATPANAAFADGTISNNTKLRSITAGFSAADVGRIVTGTGVGPNNTNTIASIDYADDVNGTIAILTNPGTNGAVTFTIANRITGLFDVTVAAFPDLPIAHAIAGIRKLDVAAATADGDADATNYLARKVNSILQPKYLPKIITQRNSISANIATAPPTNTTSGLYLLYQISLSGAPVAGQALWFVAGDPGFRMNGGSRNDKDYTGPPPIPQLTDADILLRSGNKLASYLGTFYEIYQSDFDTLGPTITEIDDILKALGGGGDGEPPPPPPPPDVLPPAITITGVNYQNEVLYHVADLLNVDPSKGISRAELKRWANGINRHVRYAWRIFRWPELILSEERAFATIWNEFDQYNENELVYWLGELDADGALMGTGYYRTIGLPPVGTSPSDGFSFSAYTLNSRDFFIPILQRCRWRIGDMLDVSATDYTLGLLNAGSYYPLTWRRSQRGIEIYGSSASGAGNTVFIRHRIEPLKYTSVAWSATVSYRAGDLALWTDGNVYRAIIPVLGTTPADNIRWALVPFPVYFAEYAAYMTAADNADDRETAQQYRQIAQEYLSREMDALYVQDAAPRYSFANTRRFTLPAGTSGFIWSAVPPFTAPDATNPAANTIYEGCLDEFGDVIPHL